MQNNGQTRVRKETEGKIVAWAVREGKLDGSLVKGDKIHHSNVFSVGDKYRVNLYKKTYIDGQFMPQVRIAASYFVSCEDGVVRNHTVHAVSPLNG